MLDQTSTRPGKIGPISEFDTGAAKNQDIRPQPLDAIFQPGTVAVIGASPKEDSLGYVVLQNLLGPSFKGTVFPVNPHYTSFSGKQVYSSVTQIETPVDLAVIVTPAPVVGKVIEDCVKAGVKGAIVISAGFKERGDKGARLEQELVALAARGGLRLVGPNCLGVMRPHSGLNATFSSKMALPGKVAFISQSGALCTAVLDWSLKENIGFSAFVSAGSMADVGWGDLIDYFGDDPFTKSIIIYMESIGNARQFISAAREVALNKPIIVLKAGRTSQAAQAAATHTGALTGNDAVLDAVFKRCGVLRVNTIEELFYMAEALDLQPYPQGPKLTIVTNAGGPGVLATDELIQDGGELARLSEDNLAALNEVLPRHWSHANPVDIIGDATPERYRQVFEILSKMPDSDGLLAILTPQATTRPLQVAGELKEYASTKGKTILASFMGGAEVTGAAEVVTSAGIPNFPYPDMAARVFNYMWRYSRNLNNLYQTPSPVERTFDLAKAKSTADRIIGQAYRENRALLNEIESKQLLGAYGLPVTKMSFAKTEDEAIYEAEKIGYPVVLKLLSSTITHKSTVGGVHLNLGSADEVVQAFRLIEAAVDRLHLPQGFEGVSVQPMQKNSGAGCELIIGSSEDAQFGPVLLFGAGGELVESFQDTAIGLPPLNSNLAHLLIEQTRIYKVLQGIRGRPPVDLAALEQLLVNFSYLVAEERRIREIDINPLLAEPDGLTVLDARVLLAGPTPDRTGLPGIAIRPYPAQYVWDSTLRDKAGTKVTIRPVRPEDEPLMLRFNKQLSDETIYYRYLHMRGFAARTEHRQLTRVCFIDYDREIVLVADYFNPESNEHEILGIGQLNKIHGSTEAELALLVSDAYQRKGLGEQLARYLIQLAAPEGICTITGDIHPSNMKMQNLCRKLGFTLDFNMRLDLVKAKLPIAQPPRE